MGSHNHYELLVEYLFLSESHISRGAPIPIREKGSLMKANVIQNIQVNLG